MSSIWQDIKDKLDILEVIGEYVAIKQIGSVYKCICPFHQDKNPSLIISPEKGLWHCFGCGNGGDMFKFVMMIDNLDKKEVLQKLSHN
jgi:DNA primase